MFRKILIANRGEIAVRVIRACRETGIRSVGVYSDMDRSGLHVRMADEAYGIGEAAARESYLNIGRILEAARKSGAEAIHPGYGFLSENARFARACEEAGIKFIGPTAAAMEVMGSKTRARQAVERAGIACVPGTSRGVELEEARRVAAEIGYPVMLKAAAGGGGKGMRRVDDARELESAFEAAGSEAARAFGDREVYVEKLILRPRHIEMQVLADEHGKTLWLGERECTVQRRHQKVLEESPSPVVSAAMRQEMGEVAVRVAKAAGYSNAGTVEFLVNENRDFYFLEMNTRLQVEHPVTESVTGLDLVQLQIRIAAGERLELEQDEVRPRGHAIECRIYAEDPENNFFPSPGKITRFQIASGPGVRHDSGIYEGWTVPLEYDPLLSKLIAFGGSRDEAIARMRRALDETFVSGITTNLSLFRRIFDDSEFKAGNLDTGFLDRLLTAGTALEERPAEEKQQGEEDAVVAAMGMAILSALDSGAGRLNSKPDSEPDSVGSARETGAAGGGLSGEASGWKQAGRLEGLRGQR